MQCRAVSANSRVLKSVQDLRSHPPVFSWGESMKYRREFPTALVFGCLFVVFITGRADA